MNGEKFFGLMLNDGRIGICSTLGKSPDTGLLEYGKIPDTDDPCHRIILNAYLNARLNYGQKLQNHSDIFDRIDFTKYREIVMIGFFETLFEKFSKKGIRLTIFDLSIENSHISPIDGLKKALVSADAVIMTGTTIFNCSFRELIQNTGEGCHIFLLGPSNILHRDMLKYRNVKIVFGSVFERYDMAVLEKIRQGMSAKHFLGDENKVYLTPDIPGNTSHFVLAGLSIPIWRWRDCDREVEAIKKKYALSGSEIQVASAIPVLEKG